MSVSDGWRWLEAVLAELDTAMLVTRSPDGRMRSRPAAILTMRDDASILFAVASDPSWSEQLRREDQVNVALQWGERFVSLTGRGRIVADRTLLDRIASGSWKVWFPGGSADPSLRLVAVNVEEADSWDRAGGPGTRHV